jgi:hypothetical protein
MQVMVQCTRMKHLGIEFLMHLFSHADVLPATQSNINLGTSALVSAAVANNLQFRLDMWASPAHMF